MDHTEKKHPATRPTLRYLVPYPQTIIGFVVVTAAVVLLILLTQLLMWI
jgi:hypothetical protein